MLSHRLTTRTAGIAEILSLPWQRAIKARHFRRPPQRSSALAGRGSEPRNPSSPAAKTWIDLFAIRAGANHRRFNYIRSAILNMSQPRRANPNSQNSDTAITALPLSLFHMMLTTLLAGWQVTNLRSLFQRGRAETERRNKPGLRNYGTGSRLDADQIHEVAQIILLDQTHTCRSRWVKIQPRAGRRLLLSPALARDPLALGGRLCLCP